MGSPQIKDDPFKLNRRNELVEWHSLLKSIDLAEKYKLFLVSAKPEIIFHLVNELQNRFGTGLVQLNLTYPIQSLHQEIRKRVSGKSPRVLLVSGLEQSLADKLQRDRFFSQLNIFRDHFARDFSFPLILFFPENGMGPMSAKAPDFFSVRSGFYKFTDALLKALNLIPTKDQKTVPEPGPLPTGSRIPFVPLRNFVNRKEQFLEIARHLLPWGKSKTSGVLLTGAGGIGKTELALQFAQRYGRFFSGGVFWVSCSDPGQIPNEIGMCGQEMGLFGKDTPIGRQAEITLNAWRSNVPRLVVFDDCNYPETLDPWSPKSGGCRALVTSRNMDWEFFDKGNLRLISLDTLSVQESVAALCLLDQRLFSREKMAARIAATLGNHPLALHLAGSYLAYFKADPTKFLAEFKEVKEKGLDFVPIFLTTLKLTFQQLKNEGESGTKALRTLARLAVLAPGVPVPLQFLMDFGDLDNATIPTLFRLGLVEELPNSRICLHPLISDYLIGSNLTDACISEVAQALVKRVDNLLGSGNPRHAQDWLPHLRHLVNRFGGLRDPVAGMLCGIYGFYLYLVGSYQEAEAYLKKALHILENNGEIQLIRWCSNLYVILLRAMGRLEEAEPLIRNALVINEKTQNRNDLVASDLNNLAAVLMDMGSNQEAEPLLRRALAIEEKLYGSGHPRVGETLGNLGYLLNEKGDLDEAIAAFRRALYLNEKNLGPDHPNVAADLNNLALALQNRGQGEEAEHLLRRAIAIDESALGREHPNLAIKLNNLALLLADFGRYKEALPLMERSFRIFEGSLGPDHPKTKDTKSHLARLIEAHEPAQL